MLRNRNRQDYDYYSQGYDSYYPPQGGYNANYQNYNNNWYDPEQQDGYWRFVPDDEPKERSINIKRVILLLLALVLVVGGIGGGVYFFLHRDQSAVMVCESQTDYNKGIGLTFYLGEDGKTIEQIDKVDTVSLDFISNNLNTENTKEIFDEPVYLEAAQITGCKNFSPVKKVDERHFLAQDWGIFLQEACPVKEADYVGIRAHYFTPAQEEGENIFPLCRAEITESPFEIYVTFFTGKEKAAVCLKI